MVGQHGGLVVRVGQCVCALLEAPGDLLRRGMQRAPHFRLVQPRIELPARP